MTRVLLAAVLLAAAPPIPGPTRRRSVSTSGRCRPRSRRSKYQLLPESAELNPGNAAQDYLKCFMEQRTSSSASEAVAERARYQTMPLAELRRSQLKGYGGAALRQADWAARLDTARLAGPPAQPGRRHGRRRPGSWGRSRSWRRRSRSGSVPRWPGTASTTRSAPPRRCSRCPGTWANTPRRSPTSSGCGSRTSASARLEEMVQQPAAPTSTGR